MMTSPVVLRDVNNTRQYNNTESILPPTNDDWWNKAMLTHQVLTAR